MARKNFEYKDPRFLNKLATLINPDKCELNAYLSPNNLEFIKLKQDRSAVIKELELLSLFSFCEENNIMPFCSLVFWQDFDPDIKYEQV